MRHSTKIASKAYRKINVPEIKGNFEGYTPKETVALSLPRKKTDSFNPKEYSKQYYEKNKEKMQEYYKIKITCDCGCEIRKDAISQHKKSNKHKNCAEHFTYFM